MYRSKEELRNLRKCPLSPFRTVLKKIEQLPVEWVVLDNGRGGIRSKEGRCPLKELNYFKTMGKNLMPTAKEAGLKPADFRRFIAAADGYLVDMYGDDGPCSLEPLRKAILTATRCVDVTCRTK